jgi:hypothetical protein
MERCADSGLGRSNQRPENVGEFNPTFVRGAKAIRAIAECRRGDDRGYSPLTRREGALALPDLSLDCAKLCTPIILV